MIQQRWRRDFLRTRTGIGGAELAKESLDPKMVGRPRAVRRRMLQQRLRHSL